MNLNYFLLYVALVTFSLHSRADSYFEVERNAFYAELDAFASAMKLKKLRSTGSDELRLWAFEPLLPKIYGVIMKPGKVEVCYAFAEYNGSEVIIKSGKCKKLNKQIGEKILLQFQDALINNDGKSLKCTVLDGVDFQLEGVFKRKRYAFDAGSPSGCSDFNAEQLNELIQEILNIVDPDPVD